MILRFLKLNWLPLGLSLILAGLLWYALSQKDRAETAETLAASRQTTITAQQGIINAYSKSVEAQNKAIEGLAQRREEGRVIYLQDYARADERAKAFDLSAGELLAQQATFTDELAECRATKALLEQELTNGPSQ